ENLLTSPNPSWSTALWREGPYWAAWVILIPPIFRLRRWLHDGPQRWPRYALGLTAGAGLTIVLLPLFLEAIRLGLWSIGWKLFWAKQSPPAFWSDYRVVFLHFLTAAVVIYSCTIIAWHAVTHYREAKERRLESAELGEMLQKAQLQALRSQLNPHFL